ncbi:MAG: hypothetical protein LBL63_04330 [Clostridiales Family XIII bacterium]|nr:hypothetical protein [Clostridiales Family XIII bacterium]
MRSVSLGAGGTLKEFEKRALERAGGGFLLPVTLVEGADGTRLLYRTDGYTALSEYAPPDLTAVFEIARSFILRLTEGRDRLLDPRGFFVSPDAVYVRGDLPEIGLIFGMRGASAATDADLAMPVLDALSESRHIVGAMSAVGRIADRIRDVNAGFPDMRRIIDAVEREWRRIQPEMRA